MPKPMSAKAHRVILTDHAYERFCERCRYIRRGKLAALLTARLNAELGRGLHLDKTGAGWIEIEQLLWASARLTDRGWVITTVIMWGESRDESCG